MDDYIPRKEAIIAVCRARLPDSTEDGIPIANGKRSVTDCVRRIKEIPTANVRKVVLCGDCIHLNKAESNGNGFYRCDRYDAWQDADSRVHMPIDGFCSYGDKGMSNEIEVNIYDREEIHENCTVQVLTNSVTGEVSVEWWEELK
jgi:hypothetical protein